MRKMRYSLTLLREFGRFAREHRAYWLIPLMLVLGVAGVIAVTGQVAAPLLYTLF